MLKFCWMLIFFWIKLSWHSCSIWDKPRWFNWFWQFLCEGLSSFNLKGFYYSYVCSCSLCEGRASFWIGKLCRFLRMLLTGFTSLSVLLLFCSTSGPSLFSSLGMFFHAISSDIDEVLLINPSANELVFGDFHIHHEDLLTYSGGTDRPDELCYNFFFLSFNFSQTQNRMPRFIT